VEFKDSPSPQRIGYLNGRLRELPQQVISPVSIQPHARTRRIHLLLKHPEALRDAQQSLRN
jgi:hypothetical protein